MTYKEKLKHPKWQKKRLEILQRDDFKCSVCGNDEKTLHVHHKKYIKGRQPWDYGDENFSTLCEDCHKQEHTKKDKSIEVFDNGLIFIEKELLIYFNECYDMFRIISNHKGQWTFTVRDEYIYNSSYGSICLNSYLNIIKLIYDISLFIETLDYNIDLVINDVTISFETDRINNDLIRSVTKHKIDYIDIRDLHQ